MRFDIITIFPETIKAIFSESILAKAKERGLIDIQVHDLREYTTDKRKTIDDRPFGGGPGMLMMLEPIYKCLVDIGVHPQKSEKTQILLTSAGGKVWNQAQAQDFAENVDQVVLICGHYEGVDYRVVEHLIDAEVSIGSYVLTGGELPAAIITDSIARLLPEVIGNPDSLNEESHNHLTSTDKQIEKEYPQYTRPAEFLTAQGETWQIPEVLLSGNHQKIKDWRERQSK